MPLSQIKKFLSSTVFLAILACLLWSTAFAAIKIGLRYSEPFSFAGLRFMLSGLLLAPFWLLGGIPLATLRANWRLILLVSFFQTFVLYGLFYFGITLISGAMAAIIIGVSPLTTAIVAHLFIRGDSMTVSKIGSLCLGIFGIIILSISRYPWQSMEGFKEFGGILILLVATISSAYGNILVSQKKTDIDPVMLNSIQLFTGGLFLFFLSIPMEGFSLHILPAPYYGALLWLAALSAISFSLWFILLQRPKVKVSALNIWKFVIPVFGAIISWIILPDESPTIPAVVGMLCIGVSIIFYNLRAEQELG